MFSFPNLCPLSSEHSTDIGKISCLGNESLIDSNDLNDIGIIDDDDGEKTVDAVVEIKRTMFELFLLRAVRFVSFVFLC